MSEFLRLVGWRVSVDMHVLHTFIGVRAGDSRDARDRNLTTVRALSMDAVAAGLIVMVCSSYIMWYQLKRRGGIIALVWAW